MNRPSLATITSLRGIVSPRVLGSFALLGLFALLPALYGKIRTRPEVVCADLTDRPLYLIQFALVFLHLFYGGAA